MIEHYKRLKAEYPDAILLFLNGDFYELYGEDANTAAEIVGLAFRTQEDEIVGLAFRTQEDEIVGLAFRTQEGMAFLAWPCHISNRCIKLLVEAGKRVVIVEQVK